MKVVNKVECKIEGFEKCHVICDQDCPLGQLFDYACAFKSLVQKRINDIESQSQPSKTPDIVPEVEKAE